MHLFFFFNDTATTEIYTLSLHDALPISPRSARSAQPSALRPRAGRRSVRSPLAAPIRLGRRVAAVVRHEARSEEHTSELQSRQYLVCRLLLEKKKNKQQITNFLTHNQTR